MEAGNDRIAENLVLWFSSFRWRFGFLYSTGKGENGRDVLSQILLILKTLHFSPFHAAATTATTNYVQTAKQYIHLISCLKRVKINSKKGPHVPSEIKLKTLHVSPFPAAAAAAVKHVAPVFCSC